MIVNSFSDNFFNCKARDENLPLKPYYNQGKSSLHIKLKDSVKKLSDIGTVSVVSLFGNISLLKRRLHDHIKYKEI